MPGLLPPVMVDALVEDVTRVRADAVRTQLSGYKGSSSIAWPILRAGAPR